MLNSDIFNFEFVDRKSERDSVDNFLTDCQNSENVLWLSGKHERRYGFTRREIRYSGGIRYRIS